MTTPPTSPAAGADPGKVLRDLETLVLLKLVRRLPFTSRLARRYHLRRYGLRDLTAAERERRMQTALYDIVGLLPASHPARALALAAVQATVPYDTPFAVASDATRDPALRCRV